MRLKPAWQFFIGSDVSRSILLFAKGQPLGKHGLDWLKIHLINLTGFKKRCVKPWTTAKNCGFLFKFIDNTGFTAPIVNNSASIRTT